MPVNDRHRLFRKYAEQWEQISDCVTPGAVKAAGEKYLPRLGWKKDADKRYRAYKARALFEEQVARAWEGMRGLVFSKPPDVKVPANFAGRLNDITLSGVPFASFASQVFGEVLAPGRVGVLVDAAPVASGQEIRPYARWYSALNVTNWVKDQVGGEQIVRRWVLREEREEVDPKDAWGFAQQIVEQYRVLDLIDGSASGAVVGLESSGSGRYLRHTVWRQMRQGDDTSWMPVEQHFPRRRGVALDFMPFVPFNPGSIEADPEDPPLFGLSEINISAYCTSADLESARHWCGHPQPWASGVTTRGEGIEWGSTELLLIPDPQGKLGIAELSGDSIPSLERAVEEKRQQAVAQGARLLQPQKMAAEAALKAALDQAGENSVLGTMAGVVGQGFRKVLAMMAWWQAGTGEFAAVEESVACALNTDFQRLILDPQGALALAQAWQARGMSRSTMTYNLQRGGMLPPGRTAEDEEALIRAEDQEMEPRSLADLLAGQGGAGVGGQGAGD